MCILSLLTGFYGKIQTMEVKKLQKLCAQIVSKIDKKYGIKRSLHFSFTQLMEEIGELAKDVNLPKLKGKKRNIKNLEEEFADVFLQLSVLAKMLNVDLGKSVKDKIKLLEKKHKIR